MTHFRKEPGHAKAHLIRSNNRASLDEGDSFGTTATDSTEQQTSGSSSHTLIHQRNITEEQDIGVSSFPQKCGGSNPLAVVALCSIMLVQAYLLISVFPYSGYMAVHLLQKVGKDITTNNVGTYAGILSSSFMVGRFFSSLGWGKLADTYGRRTALLLSVSLSGFFSILFGMSPTYGCAILFRMCLGLSNGLTGTVKTLVSELSKGNHPLEEKTMGIVIGVWGYGFLLCPAISGMLSEPLEQYPQFHDTLVALGEGSPWWALDGLTLVALQTYPFILPNLIALFWCLVSLVLVLLFVPETLSQDRKRNLTVINLIEDMLSTIQMVLSRIARFLGGILEGKDKSLYHGEAESLLTPNEGTLSAGNIRNDKCMEYSTCEVENGDKEDCSDDPHHKALPEKESVITQLWSIKATRDHLLVYWFFSFFSILPDEAFPLFCMSLLGLSESKIGQILTGSGAIFILGQYVTYAWLTNRFGLYGSLKIAIFLSSPIPFFISFSTWINNVEGEEGVNSIESNGVLSTVTFFYLSIVIGIYKVMVSAFFATITVSTNRTVDMSLRASVNGLGMMGGSIAKATGPICAGALVTLFHGHGPIDGLLIFGVISLVGIALSLATRNLNEQGCHTIR